MNKRLTTLVLKDTDIAMLHQLLLQEKHKIQEEIKFKNNYPKQIDDYNTINELITKIYEQIGRY